MLKFFCFVIVSACGTMLGLEFRRKLSVRLHSLIMFQSLFTEIKGMISYSGYTLNEIMCELSALHPGNKFILKCSEYTLHQSFKSAWKNTLESMKNEYSLLVRPSPKLPHCTNFVILSLLTALSPL